MMQTLFECKERLRKARLSGNINKLGLALTCVAESEYALSKLKDSKFYKDGMDVADSVLHMVDVDIMIDKAIDNSYRPSSK